MADEPANTVRPPEQAAPGEANPVAAASPAAATLQAAPAAVRRSMPMALSICLGLLLAAFAGWLFYYLTWFILLLYLSFVAATILEAPVHWLKTHGIRRGFAAAIIMVGGLAIVGTGLYFIGSGIYNQVAAVKSNLELAPARINAAVNEFKHHFLHHPPSSAHNISQVRPQHPVSGGPALVHAPGMSPPRSPASNPAPSPVSVPMTPSTQGPPTTAATPATSQAASEPATDNFDIERTLGNAVPSLGTLVANALRGIEAVSWLVIMFFLVLYMLVDGPDHLKGLRTLLPKHLRLESTKLFHEIAHAHRGWALASAANVCSASILTGTGLFLLGVPGAFILGFFAGLGELIPNIGPFAGAMPALLLTLVADPYKFPYVVGMFVIVQTIQSYTISPRMLKFSIELPVLVTIISVLVFGTLFGFLGILVAIPFVADMVVVWRFVGNWREKDTQDYDMINLPAGQKRRPLAVNARLPLKLRSLFRRQSSGK